MPCWHGWKSSTTGTADGWTAVKAQVSREKVMPPPQSGAGSGEAGAPTETIAPRKAFGTFHFVVIFHISNSCRIFVGAPLPSHDEMA